MGQRPTSALAACLLAAALLAGCRKREPPEADRARSVAAFRLGQIESLEKLIAQAERGDLVTTDQIAIGISEDVVKGLMNASLPREIVVAKRVRVRIESAEPIFRGNRAALVFHAKASIVDAPRANATVEMSGALEDFRLENGRLSTRVSLVHFRVLEASIGELAADALDGLVKANTATIQGAIPELEIPVQIEQAIRIGGLTEGAVVAKSGTLPLALAVSHVIPINQRLWLLLQAKAGPWQADPTTPPGVAP